MCLYRRRSSISWRICRSDGAYVLFVSHDLSMVRHISHEVGVMYLGHMVEMAPVEELFAHMQHPYTRALLSAGR